MCARCSYLAVAFVYKSRVFGGFSGDASVGGPVVLKRLHSGYVKAVCQIA